MIAVSNTTPLRYLIAIDQDHLLGQIFEKVLLPTSVFHELTDKRTPERVRDRIRSTPAWLQIREAPKSTQIRFPLALHQGEREAILLAEATRCDVLLIDDRAGRNLALSLSLPVSGTLAFLEEADKHALVADFPSVLDQLMESGFYVRPFLRQRLLQRYAARHSR